MTSITRRSTPAAVLLAAVAAVLVVFVTLDQASGQAPPRSPLATVDRDMLESSKIAVAEPASARVASAKVGRAAAEQLARAKFPGYTVREVALLEVVDTIGGAAQSCLCWVVSSLPTEGQIYVHQPPPADGETARPFTVVRPFHLDFIDAVTGEYLYSAEGSQLAR